MSTNHRFDKATLGMLRFAALALCAGPLPFARGIAFDAPPPYPVQSAPVSVARLTDAA